MPREAPEFLVPLVQRGLIVRRLPRLDRREMDRIGSAEAGHRDVLKMLRERERPGFEHEHAVLFRLVALENRGGQRAAKRAAADDDDIEGSRIRALAPVSAGEGFIEAVANEAADDIARKRGVLRVGG